MGCPLFENTDDGYKAFPNLTVAQKKSFDPKGCLLVAKLSLYKDEESPFLYKQYFCGMSKTNFLLSYCVLEVSDRENLQKWKVVNCLFRHLNCSDLEAVENMTKMETFVLLDKSSLGIPVLDVVLADADVETTATDEIGDDIPETYVVPQRQKRQREVQQHENEESVGETSSSASTAWVTRGVWLTNLSLIERSNDNSDNNGEDDITLEMGGVDSYFKGNDDSSYKDKGKEDIHDDGEY
eukprot:526720-Ditylum_brightwellii.AAC.1